MVFATKLLLDKTKKSTDSEIRKIALIMETVEKFDHKNKIHLIGKSEQEIIQILAVSNMFLQYNEDQSGYMDITDAYKFME
jgi:hypothetical protein